MTTALDNLRVASPCPISWDEMVGNDCVRFCKHCELNVYNFSELTRKEAEALLSKTSDRLCGRLYRRMDGTLLTKDCPVGLRALRKRVSRRAAAVFATLIGICSVAFGQSSAKDKKASCTPQVKITETHNVSHAEPRVLTGTVLDPNGAVVPGAKVVIKGLANFEKTCFTTSDGTFSLAGVANGTYSINIEASGFRKLTLTDVKL